MGEMSNNFNRFMELMVQNQANQNLRSQSYAREVVPTYLQAPAMIPAMQNTSPPEIYRRNPGISNPPGRGYQRPQAATSDGCFWCEDPSHFMESCDKRKELEQEGWIFKPEKVRWYFLKNGKSIPRKAVSGLCPQDYVQRFKDEQAKLIRAQNAQQEEDCLAPDDFTYDGQAVYLSTMAPADVQGFT